MRATTGSLGSFIRKLAGGDRGSVAIQIGLMLTILVGFAALGVEITFVLMKHRQMQSAADGAAIGAAVAIAAGYPTDFASESRAIAADAGFVNGANGVSVTVNRPPLSGLNAGNDSAVEVIVGQPQNLALVRVFRSGVFDVRARAVAIVGATGGLYCMLALDPAASAAASFMNNAAAVNPDCGIAVNSSSSTALVLKNNAAVYGPVSVHGGWSLSNNAELYGEPIKQNAPTVADPYAAVTLQPIPACTAQSGTVNAATRTLDPGHFCSGFNFINNATVTLNAGTYYVDTKLAMQNNVLVQATAGVTIVVNGNYAIAIGNNAVLHMTAPSTGPYAGLALIGLRTATPTVSQVFGNNAVVDITGAIYFPNQIVHFSNNGAVGISDCTQVIARIVDIDNNVNLDNKCALTGVKPIGGSNPQLVE